MKLSPNDKGHHRPTQLLTAIFHFLLFFHRPPFLSPLLSPLLSSGKLTGSSVEERKARGEVKRAWGEDARLKFRVSSTYLYSPPFNLSSPSFFSPSSRSCLPPSSNLQLVWATSWIPSTREIDRSSGGGGGGGRMIVTKGPAWFASSKGWRGEEIHSVRWILLYFDEANLWGDSSGPRLKFSKSV